MDNSPKVIDTIVVTILCENGKLSIKGFPLVDSSILQHIISKANDMLIEGMEVNGIPIYDPKTVVQN